MSRVCAVLGRYQRLDARGVKRQKNGLKQNLHTGRSMKDFWPFVALAVLGAVSVVVVFVALLSSSSWPSSGVGDHKGAPVGHVQPKAKGQFRRGGAFWVRLRSGPQHLPQVGLQLAGKSTVVVKTDTPTGQGRQGRQYEQPRRIRQRRGRSRGRRTFGDGGRQR